MLTTLSAKSWHFRLVRNFTNIPLEWEPVPKTPEEVAQVESGDTFGIERIPTYTGNLCNYLPYVLKGMFIYLSLLVVITSLLMPVAAYVGYLAACIATMSAIPLMGAGLQSFVVWIGMIFTWCPITLLLLSYICSAIGAWNSNRTYEKHRRKYLAAQEDTVRYVEVYGELPPTPKEPGFLTACYRKFKDKTCIGLKIK